MTSHARHMLSVMNMTSNAAQPNWFVRILPVYRIFIFVLYVGTLALAGYALYQVTQTGDWEHLWNRFDFRFALLVPALFYVENLYGRGAASELVNAFRAIRGAAARGDERIAPLAANQPLPYQEATAVNASAAIGPLHGPYDSQYARPVYALLCALMAVMTIVVLAGAAIIFWFDTFGWTTPNIADDPTTDAIIRAIFGCFGVVMLGVTVACVWLVARLEGMKQRGRRGMRIAADERGLSWIETANGKRRHLAWNDVHLFFLVADDGGPRLPPVSFHALLGPGAPLVWMTPSPANADQWAAHIQLCRLIVKATHLPLRDLSKVSEKLAQVSLNAAATQQDTLAELIGRNEGISVPGVSFERIRASAKRQMRLVLALEAPYALLIVVGLVGSILQHFGVG